MQRWHALLPLLILAALAPARTSADDKKPVDMEIWIIRATAKNDKISPELKEIADRLKKDFKFRGFKLEKKIPGKAEIGKAFSTDLIGGYKATVTPTGRTDKEIQLKVEVTQRVGKEDKKAFSFTPTFDLGKLLPVGAADLNDGDKLIVAIRAR
jgi:hypothetical protein